MPIATSSSLNNYKQISFGEKFQDENLPFTHNGTATKTKAPYSVLLNDKVVKLLSFCRCTYSQLKDLLLKTENSIHMVLLAVKENIYLSLPEYVKQIYLKISLLMALNNKLGNVSRDDITWAMSPRRI